MNIRDRIEALRKKPQNEGKSENDLIQDIYNAQQSQISDLKRDLNEAKKAKQRPLSVDLSTSGELVLKSKSYDKSLETSSVATKTIVKSEVLKELENLLSPLLEATKAMYKAGGLLNETVLRQKDSDGNYTKAPQLDSQGNQLYQVNPVSRFKMICWVLENNDQAKSAVKAISEVLEGFTKEKLSQMSVDKKDIKSSAPIKPSPTDSLMDQLRSEGFNTETCEWEGKTSSTKKKTSPVGDD